MSLVASATCLGLALAEGLASFGTSLISSAKAKPKHVAEATKLIKALSEDFDPKAYEDRHRKRLQKLIAEKKKGKEIEIPDDPEVPEPVSDIMAALRESLAAARS